MKTKGLFKNIFYIIFALCFLGAGLFTLGLQHSRKETLAEETSGQEVVNENIPDYFGITEYNGDQPASNSFIDTNIFAYTENHTLTLSLKHNDTSATHDIYNYVYYPNSADSTRFIFYVITSVGLTYNGVEQSIVDGNYINKCVSAFPGFDTNNPDQFQINFGDFTDIEVATGPNFSIADHGVIKEGLYSLSLTYMLVTCTDGTDDMTEKVFTSENAEINYNFYVVDKNHYLTNNMPNATRANFDKSIQLNNNSLYNFYLYSNHSYDVDNSAQSNKLPYIEYDYTRYELQINRELSNLSYSQNLLYDLDAGSEENAVVSSGDNFVHYTLDTANHTAKVFFTALGNCSVVYKDILLLDNNGTTEKHYLTGLSTYTKMYMVYIFGYQANYTDMDGAPDENNIRPVEELKNFDFENGVFNQSADITSAFLNSNASYSQENANETFLISNITNFINDNNIQPVKTNQTPIKFSSNAFLANRNDAKSYIFTTNDLGWPEETYVNLHGETLYKSNFVGQAEGTTGTYIYVIAYTFNNYRESEATPGPNRIFYQVFYFEINKDIPTISVKTSNDLEYGEEVGEFTNKNVYIFDTTKDNIYNKDVQIRIYAKDFSGNFVLGGENGVTYDSLLQDGANSVELSASAHYTVRLYYKNQVNETNISYYSSKDKIREVYFTIDKEEISDIRGTNVAEVINSSNYDVVRQMTHFATNQNFAISWDKKASGASTYAYYRYFNIDAHQYYNTADDGAHITDILMQMFRKYIDSYLPIEYTLDMQTEGNDWNRYKDNAIDEIAKGSVSSEYVFSDGGLYLVDVFDDAGNHKIAVFLLDYTAPMFALYDQESSTYSLPNKSVYISSDSTISWADYKALYVTNLRSAPFVSMTPERVAAGIDTLPDDALYRDYTGSSDLSLEIYTALYNTLKRNNFFTNLDELDLIPTGQSGDDAITDYSGIYLAVPIDDTYYFLNENNIYEKRTNSSSEDIIITDKEMSYSILIRDRSNTKYVTGLEESDAVQNYTRYYSAIQKATVSFDSSQFRIGYIDGKGEFEDLTILTNSVEDTTDEGFTRKTSYLNPTSLNKAFLLTFTPTQSEEGAIIQVDSVVVKYYPYKTNEIRKTITERVVEGGEARYVTQEIIYTYYTLDEHPTEINVYTYNGEATTEEVAEYIRLNSDGYTMAGKYEISRTYSTAEGFTHNDTDFVVRTYVFYVDRNEVISNPELVDNDAGSHLESLVGGDIFISMYDNGTQQDLLISFPDSYHSNPKGSSLYNSGVERTILTTNKLPVRIYVPQFKYTQYVSIESDSQGYHYKVDFDDVTNNYDKDKCKDTRGNPKPISEYRLYARIFKDSKTNLYAQSSLEPLKPDYSNIEVENGFLVFRKVSDYSIVRLLTEPGIYYVEITQGANSDSFTQVISFSFEVQQTNPDFIAYTTSGTKLNSVEQPLSKISEVYYTNQPIVQLVWDKGSDYIAEIDQANIKLETSMGQTFIGVDSDIWQQKPTASNNTWISQINFERLGVYTNNAYVDITMQYENHSIGLYKTITKRIYVDLSAPHANIEHLVENSTASNLISGLTSVALRKYYTYDMANASSLDNTCYNLSSQTGNFAYYSYYVTADFLSSLRNSEEYKTYAREFLNKYVTGIEQETSPADFLPTNFKSIDEISEFVGNTYYEIVETDMAGNITIYTIFVADKSTDRDLLSFNFQETTNFAYTTDDYNLRKTYEGSTHNIYSNTGLAITGIDYFGDVWAQFTLTKTSGARLYLMMTPWDPTHVYAFANGTATPLDISSIIDGSLNTSYKNELKFYNRDTCENDSFYVNTRNPEFRATLTDVQEREYIRFTAPTDSEINSTTRAATYLTALKITANGETIYNKENKLGYVSLWQSNGAVTVSYNAASKEITFELTTSFAPNAKIIYEYTSNYGVTKKEIHLYKETIIPESKKYSSLTYLYGYHPVTSTELHYITQNDFQYTYNPAKYAVTVYDYENGTKSDNPTERIQITETILNGIKTMTLHQVDSGPYFDTFAIEVRDASNDAYVGTIYVSLYNQLPTKNYSDNPNEPGQFKLLDASRKNITAKITNSVSPEERGYFSEVTLRYTQDTSTLLPIVYSYSMDRIHWTEVQNGMVFKNLSEEMVTYYLKVWYNEQAIENEVGSARYLFEDVSSEQIYEFNLSSLTSTYWVEKTMDGITTIVEKSGTIYKTRDGKQYSNHYIVNVPASSGAITIKTNEEQGIICGPAEQLDDGSSATSSYRYHIYSTSQSQTSNFSTYIIITYVPTTDTPVTYFFTYKTKRDAATDTPSPVIEDDVIDYSSGSNIITSNKTSASYIVQKDSSISKLELQWSKFYGIEYNEIKIALTKDGTTITPSVYTKTVDGQTYNYCYLTYSGKYTISLYDIAGNVQKFNYHNPGQSERFTLSFVKDVPVTMLYTDIETEETAYSLPMKQAIYNGEVSICLDNSLMSELFTEAGQPKLKVYRNGKELTEKTDYTKSIGTDGKTKFTFTETGYYEYYFTAEAKNAGSIREEKSQFTIINANEYKYSYILNRYANHYIEKVVRNGKDVTDVLLRSLDVATIRVNQKLYLAELPLSYLDVYTGAGIYTITVNSNEKYFTSQYWPTSWTYQVIIQVGSAPINVSLPQDKSTSNQVSVTYNAANIYQEMGECDVRIIKYTKEGKYVGVTYSQHIDETTTERITTNIEKSNYGTFFVQIVSPSGTLLYSYKVTKTEPMNVATIIAIVAASLVLVAVVIIVYKLRRRISVK